MIALSLALILGCPKDRTGLSETSMMTNNAKEVETLLLKVDEIERRIAQIEEVTRARGQQEIMKMENMEQVRMEMANIRGEIETLQFHFGEIESQADSQSRDTDYRLNWLEDRADVLESTLGLGTPTPDGTMTSPTPSPEPSVGGETEAGETSASPEETEMGSSSEDQPPLTTPPETPAVETAPPTAEELLKLAEEHLKKSREEAAEAVLNRILKEYPGSDKEIEVYYRLAEASFNKGEYKTAARRFQQVIDKNSKSPWAAWALLRQGECFEEMGQKDNAKIFYQDVVSEYPKSKAAKEAKEKLK